MAWAVDHSRAAGVGVKRQIAKLAATGRGACQSERADAGTLEADLHTDKGESWTTT